MVIEIVTAASLVVIAACQIKQAFFPVIYPDYASEQTGIEVPKDVEINDQNNPVFKMIMDSYERSKTLQTPGQFIQKMIDEPGDTGVEIITDKEEREGF